MNSQADSTTPRLSLVQIRRMWEGGPLRQWSEKRTNRHAASGKPSVYANNVARDCWSRGCLEISIVGLVGCHPDKSHTLQGAAWEL